MSASAQRQGEFAPAAAPEPPAQHAWGSSIFTVIALVGSFHALLMLGQEVGRLVYTDREIARLEREVAALDAQTQELAAIVAHRDDPLFREQLARQLGFIGSDETRVLTRMP